MVASSGILEINPHIQDEVLPTAEWAPFQDEFLSDRVRVSVCTEITPLITASMRRDVWPNRSTKSHFTRKTQHLPTHQNTSFFLKLLGSGICLVVRLGSHIRRLFCLSPVLVKGLRQFAESRVLFTGLFLVEIRLAVAISIGSL